MTTREWKPRQGKDGRWRVRVHVFLGRRPDGKQQFYTETVYGDDAQEAKEHADALYVGMRSELRETGAVTAPCRETLAVYGRRWLDERRHEWADLRPGEERTGLSRRTWEGYDDTFRTLIEEPTDPNMPRLGRRQMRRLRPEHVRGLYKYLREAGAGRGRVRALHAVLRQIFRFAFGDDAITTDLATKLRGALGRQSSRRRPEAYTGEQLAAFLRAADHDPQRAFWYLFAFTGMRPGELLALRVGDVDLEARTVTVARRLRQVPQRHRLSEDERWELDEPKTENAARVVRLGERLVEVLRPILWAHEQRAQRRKKKGRWADLLFQTSTGEPLGWSNMRKSYARICRRAGLGTFVGPAPEKPKAGPTAQRKFRPLLKPYALRHTHATLLLEDGVPIGVISERLGHAKTSFTSDTYIGKGGAAAQQVAADAADRWLRALDAGEGVSVS